ncbi:hypothetical protein [Glycomyces sp. YM15]|uniref:hypothetical protein n=1 Tax=Glycomyces sp. YM15 TaxID=2800446 RepID=UPI0019663AEA|nr:hypothetical protein [Glycomyces sp. YM15]
MDHQSWSLWAAEPPPTPPPSWVETWGLYAALVLALVGIISIVIGAIQIRHGSTMATEAKTQTGYAARQLELAEQARRDQIQPYLLAEIDSSVRESQLLVLRITNAGATAAYDVKAIVTPSLVTHSGKQIHDVPISTLAPHAVWELPIDTTHGYLGREDGPRQFTVLVEGRGILGSIAPELYSIDLDQLRPKLARDSEAVVIAKALNKIEEHLERLEQASSWWRQRRIAEDHRKD